MTENIWGTPVAQYVDSHGEVGFKSTQELVAQLRGRGVLCIHHTRELWVFGNPISGALELLQGSGLDMIAEGTLAEQSLIRTAAGTDIKTGLLDAVEGAVAYRLSECDAIVHIAPRTWLLKDNEDDGAQTVLLRLRIKVTEAGTMYAATTTAPGSMTTFDEQLSSATEITLAPSGRSARLIDATQGTLQVVDGAAWKALVAAYLHAESVKLDADTIWVSVKTSDGDLQECFVWPAQLCFAPAVHTRGTCTQYDWKHYFAAPEEENGFKHPLTVAEDWFTGAVQRQAATEDAKNEVVALPATTGAEGDGALATSPPFLQRTADQQAAMAGIYPTPPDALVQGQQASQQPSSDNVIAHQDQNSFGQDLLPASDDALPRQSVSSCSNVPAVQHHGSDDLFGDMGGEMDFGAGEVGDEDFDFFNEEDAAAAAPHGDEDAVVDLEHDLGDDLSLDMNQSPQVVAATPQILDAESMDLSDAQHKRASRYNERSSREYTTKRTGS